MSSHPQADDTPGEVSTQCCPPTAGDGLYYNYGARAHEYLAEACGCARRLMRPTGPAQPADGAHLPATLAPVLPALLADAALDPPDNVLLVVPGEVPRRDGKPGPRLALIRLSTEPLGAPALARLVPGLLRTLLPGRRYRLMPQRHDLLREAMALEMHHRGAWETLGHCGSIADTVLDETGLPAARHSALLIELDLEQLHRLHGPTPVAAQPDAQK